ncbi:MAG TPA: amidohydrolase family protein [Pseudacidobacterium sp.]|nr:amidohydrolase family protein [Pseudacidobacterium sp.]
MKSRHPCLLLAGGRIAIDAQEAVHTDLSVCDSRISHATQTANIIRLDGYIVLPGLINAHDHLEFGMFPRLGSGPYPNWEAWAQDIYRPDGPPVRDLLAVPKHLRLWSGGLRNLLCGATTVAEHNPYHAEIFTHDFPVKVLSRYGWAHSLKDEQTAKAAYHQTPSEWPFFLHLAEGTDAAAAKEVDRLKQMVPLDDRLVLVHGIGIRRKQLHELSAAKVWLVWCPSSNIFTLGKTFSAKTVRAYPYLLLGSDSPLSAVGDLLDELSFAHEHSGLSAEALYPMVTTRAAAALRLENGEGSIRAGAAADLIVLRDSGKSPAETLLWASRNDIQCVIRDGALQFVSPVFSERVSAHLLDGFEESTWGGTTRLFPVSTCEKIREIQTYHEQIAEALV